MQAESSRRDLISRVRTKEDTFDVGIRNPATESFGRKMFNWPGRWSRKGFGSFKLTTALGQPRLTIERRTATLVRALTPIAGLDQDLKQNGGWLDDTVDRFGG